MNSQVKAKQAFLHDNREFLLGNAFSGITLLTDSPDFPFAASITKSPSPNKKPIIIGLYGVSGCGKTHLINELKKELPIDYFAFYDGSSVLASVIPEGGMEVFQKMDAKGKTECREKAIVKIRDECVATDRVGVVAGHYMFWDDGPEESAVVACTEADLECYTHILYLDTSVVDLDQRRQSDNESGKRIRKPASLGHLNTWQSTEKNILRTLCRDHGILFTVIPSKNREQKVSNLLQDFQSHDPSHNLVLAQDALEKLISNTMQILRTILVFDADRTLTSIDTGILFWQEIERSRWSVASYERDRDADPLKILFSSKLGYSHTAFRQATLLYEEIASEEEFDEICEKVAEKVEMYPEFVDLLRKTTRAKKVKAVIITTGIRLIWEKILKKYGLEGVEIIGGGRISDGYVVTAEVKADLVTVLKEKLTARVVAFGDSKLDLGMLKRADEAVVVVGKEGERSKSMDRFLKEALLNEGLKATQVVFLAEEKPRLNEEILPVVGIEDEEFLKIFWGEGWGIDFWHATEKEATKLLMTPMRDAKLAGPALRAAHQRVGAYLATEYVTQVVGIESFEMCGAQGKKIDGYRLRDEEKTTIVALMRGGEPLALGVNEAFPLAMFVHANSTEDLKDHHLKGQATVILVDSVINNGSTIIDFVERVRELDGEIDIIVVTGVIQEKAVSILNKQLGHHEGLSLIALRKSENKYKGVGASDTGNRLFNTTGLE